MAEPTHWVGPGVVGGGVHGVGVGGVHVRPSSKGITSCLKVCKSVTWQNSSPMNASKQLLIYQEEQAVAELCQAQVIQNNLDHLYYAIS